jgi:hypothetical protein
MHDGKSPREETKAQLVLSSSDIPAIKKSNKEKIFITVLICQMFKSKTRRLEYSLRYCRSRVY